MINVIEINGYVTFKVDKSVQDKIIIVTNRDCMQIIFIKSNCNCHLCNSE